MKLLPKKLLVLTLVTAGSFLLSAAVFFTLSSNAAINERTILSSSLIAAVVITGVLLPIVVWLVFQPPGKNPYSAYALEELSMSEEELKQAVKLWMFANRDRRVEGDLRFLENEDGTVSCRVTARKED